MSTNTDFVSGQSECSDSHNELDDPKLDNHELDNPKLDNHELDNHELDNHKLDNPRNLP